jgi:hypothetical protein
MILRLALCACTLAGCATAPAPMQPAAAQPPAAAAPAPAETSTHERSEPPAEPPQSVVRVAQPIGAVRLTGNVAALRDGKPVMFIVQGASGPALSRLSTSHPEARTTGDSIAIGPGALPSAVLDRHRTPSFLIDSDQPAVLALAQGVPAGVTPAELRNLIGAHFERVQYGDFWTASRAAARKAGDCTEHAVLLAAVARSLGMPARVVLGYAVLTDQENGYAFGHAWTEIHDGKQWQRLDATPTSKLDPTYIILSELDDEGPGYAIGTSELISILLRTTLDVELAQ